MVSDVWTYIDCSNFFHPVINFTFNSTIIVPNAFLDAILQWQKRKKMLERSLKTYVY